MSYIISNPTRPRVLLDMDGVLCDFATEYTKFKTERGLDLREFNYDAFKLAVQDRIFERLEFFSNAKEFIKFLNTQDVDVAICTSYAGLLGIVPQKQNWLEANGITYPQIFVSSWNHKYHHATPLTIMFDDRQDVCNLFRKVGAHAVVYDDSKPTKNLMLIADEIKFVQDIINADLRIQE